MPYELIETALAATFLLIWLFIGLTMLRDQLSAVRQQRLDENGGAADASVPRPIARRPRQRPVHATR